MVCVILISVICGMVSCIATYPVSRLVSVLIMYKRSNLAHLLRAVSAARLVTLYDSMMSAKPPVCIALVI